MVVTIFRVRKWIRLLVEKGTNATKPVFGAEIDTVRWLLPVWSLVTGGAHASTEHFLAFVRRDVAAIAGFFKWDRAEGALGGRPIKFILR